MTGNSFLVEVEKRDADTLFQGIHSTRLNNIIVMSGEHIAKLKTCQTVIRTSQLTILRISLT